MKIFDPKLTGSIVFENTVQGNIEITGDLVVPGSITAREFKTEFVSASIIFQSGSTQFGDTSDDTHLFTGRVGIGTSDPQEELDIASAGPGIQLTDTDGGTARIINLGTDLIIQSDRDNLVDTSTIQFELDGTERMRINANGTGIGEVSPQATFHVNSGVDNDVAIFESGDSTANIILKEPSGSTRLRQSANAFLIENDYDNNLADSYIGFRVDNSEAVRIDSNGNVGIGTTSPAVPLDVNAGTLNVAARFESTDDTSQIAITDDDTTAYFGARNGVGFVSLTGAAAGQGISVDASGSVGIGRANAYSTLHIESITADDTIITLDRTGTAAKGIKFNRDTATDASIIVDNLEDLRIGYNESGLGDNLILHNSGSNVLVANSDSNVGINKTDIPTGWITDYAVLHIGNAGALWANKTGNDDFQIGANAYWNGTSYVYMNDGAAGRIILNNGNIQFQTAPSGTAGDLFEFSADLYIQEGGNVGIGTTSPSTLVDIYGNGTDPTVRIHEDNALNKSQLQLRRGGNDVFLRNNSNGNFEILTESGIPTDTPIFFIDTSEDRVGIGVEYPSTILDVNGTITADDLSFNFQPTISWQGNTIDFQSSTDSIGVFRIRGSASYNPRFEVYDANNVNKVLNFVNGNMWITGDMGIGTTSASEKLHVEGNLKVTGTMDTIKVIHLKSNTTAAMAEGSANEFTVDFNLEEYRDSSYFTHTSGVITVLQAGWYRVYANMVYENADASVRNTARAFVKKNGTEITSTRTYDYDRGSTYGKYSNNKVDTMLLLAANDTVEIANYAYNEDGTMSITGTECEFIVTLFR